MNISCPNCQTVFRVDPARVPPTGIKARCSRCGSTFPVRRPEPEPAAAPAAAVQTTEHTAVAAAAPEERAHGAASAASTEGVSDETASPMAADTVPPTPEEVRAPSVGGAAVSAGPEPTRDDAGAAAAAVASEPERPQTFGSRDPNVRATRIARALVSDIIAYHPQRWESSRAAGTLRAEFRDEIMKSWEEYVAQVGLELAKTTPHFRAALNDILAGGQEQF